MRIVCLSDTHTYGKRIHVPDGDILIHAGDHTFRGTESEIRAALKWLASLPHEHKVFIAGNHDFFFDRAAPAAFRSWSLKRRTKRADILAAFPSLIYLEDSATIVAGLKFYGSPWTPWFQDWAFNLPLDDIAEAQQKWSAIPEDVDVLITHGPPFGVLDMIVTQEKLGCPALRSRISELPKLKLHVFGHIHEGYGLETIGETIFVNASNNTWDYKPLNAPIVVDLS